jgi:hypothetical protein
MNRFLEFYAVLEFIFEFSLSKQNSNKELDCCNLAWL